MKREDYKNYVWYDVTDETYWVEEAYPEEFPNCQTIVCCSEGDDFTQIYTRDTIFLGWGTMAKQIEYGWKFMIIEKP